jgi:hypothetical protein
MKNFRRFLFTLALIAAFTVPTFADGGATQTPPAPGDTQGPPAPGDTQGPSALGSTQGPSLNWAAILFAIGSAI